MALVCAQPALANRWYKEGRRAQARKDWDTALVDFERAVRSQPENPRFLIHARIARTRASQYHLEQGIRLLQEHLDNRAIGEFEKASTIDPSNQAATQYLDRMLAAEAAAKEKQEKALKKAIHKSEEQPQPTIEKLKALPKTPMAHFRITADSRQIYETLAKLSGLNVGFTSDFQPRPESLDLTNVTVSQAMNLLSLETHTFWKVVTPNTILVVPDNPANEREYETKIIRTIYLTNPMSPTQRGAITTALKQLLQMQYVIDNPESNSIIVRDTPARVAEAVQLVHDLDLGKAEILINVTVLEADASRIQTLGLEQVPTPPLTGANIAGLTYTGTVSQTVVNSTGSQTVSIPGVALNTLRNLLATKNFALVLPGAVANALLDDSHTRILQNPQVRVTDGEEAKLKIGSKIPFATGSFLPSFGGLVPGASGTTSGASNLGLLASTQFQFQNVGVNMDLTPHLMPNGDIEIKSKIDISSLGPEITMGGGLQEPSFGQRDIQHNIILKEGEVSLLGGLMQTTITHETTGVPGLAKVPVLKYFFSSVKTDRENQEVLIMLTPYVIRLPSPAVEGETAIATEGGPGTGSGSFVPGQAAPTYRPMQFPGVYRPMPPRPGKP